ncbi:hypothetical protein STXM2123_5064 [Streptomyces sp. F-3]|nr:hypothetical protein STXM2123_5064 [Streptomyces sp. F-3]
MGDGIFLVKALLPAPAGMVPGARHFRSLRAAAPRTRGDGPSSTGGTTCSTICSPHPRGWSQTSWLMAELQELLPAPAGMVPTGG